MYSFIIAVSIILLSIIISIFVIVKLMFFFIKRIEQKQKDELLMLRNDKYFMRGK